MTIVVGGVKDADHDYLLNVKNLAIATGVKITKDKKVIIPKSFKAFGLGVRFLSSIVVFVPFVFFGADFEIWHIILLALFVVSVLFLTVKLLNVKSFEKIDVPTTISRVGLCDAFGIALDIFGRTITNSIMLGSFTRTTGLVSLDSLCKGMESVAFHDAALDKNITAIQRGFDETVVSESGRKA